MRSRHMRGVNVRRCTLYIDRSATKTASTALGRLRRQRKSGVMHGIFPSRPSALPAIVVEVGRGALGQVVFPCCLEVGPRLVEARRGVLEMLTAVRRRVKATLPAPLIDVDRDTGTGRDRPDVHVAVIDVPAVWASG